MHIQFAQETIQLLQHRMEKFSEGRLEMARGTVIKDTDFGGHPLSFSHTVSFVFVLENIIPNYLIISQMRQLVQFLCVADLNETSANSVS